jgi:hypothetical protein
MKDGLTTDFTDKNETRRVSDCPPVDHGVILILLKNQAGRIVRPPRFFLPAAKTALAANGQFQRHDIALPDLAERSRTCNRPSA